MDRVEQRMWAIEQAIAISRVFAETNFQATVNLEEVAENLFLFVTEEPEEQS